MSKLIEDLKIVSPIPSKACPILDENYVIWLDTAFNIINIQPHSKFEREEEGDTVVSSEKAGIQLKIYRETDKRENELIYYYEEAITAEGIPINLASHFKEIVEYIDDMARLKTEISRFNPGHFKLLFTNLLKEIPPDQSGNDDCTKYKTIDSGLSPCHVCIKLNTPATQGAGKQNRSARRIKYYFKIRIIKEPGEIVPIYNLVLGINSDTEIESVKINGEQILSTRGEVYRRLATQNSRWQDLLQGVLRGWIKIHGIKDGHESHLMVHPLAFKLCPEVVLRRYCLFVNSVKYLDDNFQPQPGIDAGGLTRQFFHDLLGNLFDGSKDRCIKIEEGEDGGMPYIDLGSEKNEAAGIAVAGNLGYLFHRIYTHFAPRRISLGRFLPDDFFYIFHQLLCADGSYPDLNFVKSISKYALSPAFTPLLYYSAHDVSEKAKCLEILEQSCIELTDQEKNSEYALQRRIFLFLREKIDPYVVFASEIMKGMAPRTVIDMSANTPEEISKTLQGDKLDRNDVISRIRLSPEYLNTENRNYETVELKIEYLKRHIHEAADDKWLQKFLLCVTGQKNLSCSSTINVIPTSGVMCVAHTCTNTLEIPNTFDTPPFDEQNQRDRFILNLEMCMDSVEGGFQIA
jgi:hypothetical protein